MCRSRYLQPLTGCQRLVEIDFRAQSTGTVQSVVLPGERFSGGGHWVNTRFTVIKTTGRAQKYNKFLLVKLPTAGICMELNELVHVDL